MKIAMKFDSVLVVVVVTVVVVVGHESIFKFRINVN
jgi:hypothetical protein